MVLRQRHARFAGDVEWDLQEVVEVFERHYEGEIVSISVGTDLIEATANHPFWVVEGDELASRPPAEHVGWHERGMTGLGRWVDAGELEVGDELLLLDGITAEIRQIETRHESTTVYNFHVETTNTYCVGTLGILVHNRNTGGDGAPQTTVKEGIYEFPDQTAGGTPYVGQSENVPSRLNQHEAAGRLDRGTESTTPVPGGTTAREVAEHKRIQQLTGGQKAKNSPKVSNKKDPIGPARRPGVGLPEPRD